MAQGKRTSLKGPLALSGQRRGKPCPVRAACGPSVRAMRRASSSHQIQGVCHLIQPGVWRATWRHRTRPAFRATTGSSDLSQLHSLRMACRSTQPGVWRATWRCPMRPAFRATTGSSDPRQLHRGPKACHFLQLGGWQAAQRRLTGPALQATSSSALSQPHRGKENRHPCLRAEDSPSQGRNVSSRCHARGKNARKPLRYWALECDVPTWWDVELKAATQANAHAYFAASGQFWSEWKSSWPSPITVVMLMCFALSQWLA